jgi:hypothetical protein
MDARELATRIMLNLPYDPNDQQVQLIAALARFCVSSADDNPVFLLNGYAGTGKTSLTGSLVKTLGEIGVTSVLLAPTGRAAKVFAAFDPVPVYRSELRSIFKTFNISVEALKQGDSILLFPESTHNTEDGKYAKNGQVGDFFTGFAHVGVKYYEETGKQIKFYPIYLDKKKRKFIIGKGIEFNSNNDRSLEKKRLAEELRNSMENLRSF